MVEYYPQWLAGQDISADQLNEMLPKVVRKVTDTVRTSNATTSADPELQLTVAANAVYCWNGWVKYSSSTVADINLDFTAPSGALGEWAAMGAGNPVTGASATPTLRIDTSGVSGYLIRTETNDVQQARSYGGLAVGTTLSLFLYGTLRTSSGGTFSLDWAQATSEATNTTVYTDSWLSFQRVA